MAEYHKFNEEQQKEWNDWVATRPQVIKDLIKKVSPTTLYRLKSTGQRVFVISYAENGTVSVAYSGKYNLVDFEQQIFGILPEELEECELPLPDEKVGVICDTPEKVEAEIARVREIPAIKKRREENQKAAKAHLN